MITVMGASGRVGGRIAERLLESGEKVRALERSAEKLASVASKRDWRGVVVRELLGERDLTFAEATRILGTRIGKPDLSYVQFAYPDFTASLVQMRISPNVAALYAEMARAVNEGRVKSREERRPENTTPTRFEAFAETLARAYQTV
jgi:nucleoside-diphosphate-sugar epimerase